MKLLPPFLFIFILFIAFFGVSRAIDCKTGNADTIIVDKSGNGKYSTIQGAIDSIPNQNDQWIRIQINPGIYREQVVIPVDKPCIILEGQSRRTTTITYSGHDGILTSATFSSYSDHIIAKGITFKNSYNHPNSRYNSLRRDTYYNNIERNGIAGVTQALAARIWGDKSAFYECGFLGLQDTLYDDQGRHYFSHCYVEGVVDFIFGSGQSFYESCTINVTTNMPPFGLSSGYITAQKRGAPSDNGGFIFKGCVIAGTGQVYLGRAWGPYSRVIFQETVFSSVVIPEGWDAWKYEGHEGNLTYAEIKCVGPGSDTSRRVSWARKLDAQEMNKFSRDVFVNQDGWINAMIP